AADEGVQGGQIQGEVGGDGTVLEMPIVGSEQIELEVPGTLVLDVLAVDHDPEAEVPLRDLEVMEEAGYIRGHREPALALGRQLLEGQPAPVANLDGVGTAAGGQEAQHLPLKEGRIHPELEGAAAAEGGPQAFDHLTQEGHGLLGVMHVAGPI